MHYEILELRQFVALYTNAAMVVVHITQNKSCLLQIFSDMLT
jgi:hypothetical protein